MANVRHWQGKCVGCFPSRIFAERSLQLPQLLVMFEKAVDLEGTSEADWVCPCGMSPLSVARFLTVRSSGQRCTLLSRH